MILFYDDKKELEQIFRTMWRNIFEDPLEYEDFYFQNMYPKNKVLALETENEIAGMIHLNPYRILVNGKSFPLHYIVGVATLEKYRRQGIMRKMLLRCMKDMAEQGEIFTYLMPANKAYYEPFDFAFVQHFQEMTINPNVEKIELDIQIEELLPEEYEKACEFVNHFCNKHFKIFTCFDFRYLEQLQAEVACEGGRLMILKNQDEIIGFCCYDLGEESLYVRQAFCEQKEQMLDLLQQQFPEKSMVVTIDGGESGMGVSIMARILRLDLLLPLIRSKQEGKIEIHIRDSYLEHQDGDFEIALHSFGCSIKPVEYKITRSISIWNLTKILFGFHCKELLEQYPEFKQIQALSPVMIGEIV